MLFPIFQENESGHNVAGHWFTFVINLSARKFQVIDSLRYHTGPYSGVKSKQGHNMCD